MYEFHSIKEKRTKPNRNVWANTNIYRNCEVSNFPICTDCSFLPNTHTTYMYICPFSYATFILHAYSIATQHGIFCMFHLFCVSLFLFQYSIPGCLSPKRQQRNNLRSEARHVHSTHSHRTRTFSASSSQAPRNSGGWWHKMHVIFIR